MIQSGNFSLKWSEYAATISDSFKSFHSNQNFADVTIACEDEMHTQAHKVILAACSPFFQHILEKNVHPHPLIYLKGIKSQHLLSIIDFVYTGEVTVLHGQLDEFLETARELKLKGLYETQTEIKAEKLENPKIVPENKVHATNESIEENKNNRISLQNELYNDTEPLHIEILPESIVQGNESFPPNEEHSENVSKPSESIETHDMYEKVDNLWQCKVCQKTANQKCGIKRHIESHIEGVLHPCKICGKSYKTSNSLLVHKSRDHRRASHEHDVQTNTENIEENKNKRYIRNELPRIEILESVNNELALGNFEQDDERIILKDKELNNVSKPHGSIETDDMYKRVDDHWQCTVCHKTTKQKGDIKRHIEGHIEGISHSCKSCGKSYKTSASLVVHKSMEHRGLKKIN